MSIYVQEVMNRELFSVPPTEDGDRTRGYLLSLGISSAPVVNEEGHPVGEVSLRDLIGTAPGVRVSDRMTSPAVTVRAEETIDAAARTLAGLGLHHAPVVDGDGRATGFVSALDLMRALVGAPASHPSMFPHWDRDTGITWTDDATFDAAHVAGAPSGPGVIVLVHGAASQPETIVWVEASTRVRDRLNELLTVKESEARQIAWWIAQGHLRFRCASVADVAERKEVLAHAVEKMRRDLWSWRLR